MFDFNLAAQFKAAWHRGVGGGSPAGGPDGAASSQHLGWQKGSPPSGNTGGKLTPEEKRGVTVKLDWLNFSGPSGCLEEIKTIVTARLGEAEIIERGLNTYQRQWRWASGATLCFSDGRADCLLSMNGDSCDSLDGVSDQLSLLRQMHGYGFRVTRVDLAADDWERQVPLELVHAAAEAIEFVGFKLTDCRQPKRVVGGVLANVQDMRTFGRRGRDGSGTFVRVYDKGLESNGEWDCIRWEVEFGNEKAHEVGRLLADCLDGEALRTCISQLIGGAIDFKRGGSTHLNRRKRLSWWSNFVKLLGEARVIVRRVKPPLQAAAAALHRQWSKTLAYLKFAADRHGVDLVGHLREMIDQACSVFDPHDLDGRDITLNLTEAFRLGSHPGGSRWAPTSAVAPF